jgi:hypothetical protein
MGVGLIRNADPSDDDWALVAPYPTPGSEGEGRGASVARAFNVVRRPARLNPAPQRHAMEKKEAILSRGALGQTTFRIFVGTGATHFAN